MRQHSLGIDTEFATMGYLLAHFSVVLIQPSAAKQRSDQETSKSDFYQTIILPKIRPKADPKSAILGENLNFSKDLIRTLSAATFI